MKRNPILVVIGALSLLSTGACHKAVPVAARPEPPSPVAAAAPERESSLPPKAVEVSVTPAPAAQAQRSDTTMPAEVRATLDQHLARLEDALFDFNTYTIRTDATTVLRENVGVVRDILSIYPAQKLLIEGHADERGSHEYNLALGDKRARAAQEFLTIMGIPENQLTVISYGKDHPICTEETEACWQKNRRAHITAAR